MSTRRFFRTPAIGLAIGVATGLALTGTLVGCEDRPQTTTLSVYAASSLTGTFTELAEKFEASHPGIEVRLSFGGSSDLVSQIQNGAPADVFAAADVSTMNTLVATDLNSAAPETFASNTLVIITPPGNPGRVDTLADLAGPDLSLVVCAPAVPCGSATRKAAAAAGIDLAPVSEEQSVKDVLTKVAVGEGDAGLVYLTDALAAGPAVDFIDFPESAAAVNQYPITTITTTTETELAAAFMDYVLSAAGQGVLAAAGFVLVTR